MILGAQIQEGVSGIAVRVGFIDIVAPHVLAF
jgi:hypothetical protein